MFCRELLAQLEQHYPDLTTAGLRVVTIGIGKPRHAQRYCSLLAPRVTCLCHPAAEVHKAYHLDRSNLLQLANPQVLRAAGRALSHGFRQGHSTGDVTLLGGAFVVDPTGIIRYACYSRYAGDHPDWDAVLESVRVGRR